jgi:hypothetical protein
MHKKTAALSAAFDKSDKTGRFFQRGRRGKPSGGGTKRLTSRKDCIIVIIQSEKLGRDGQRKKEYF